MRDGLGLLRRDLELVAACLAVVAQAAALDLNLAEPGHGRHEVAAAWAFLGRRLLWPALALARRLDLVDEAVLTHVSAIVQKQAIRFLAGGDGLESAFARVEIEPVGIDRSRAAAGDLHVEAGALGRALADHGVDGREIKAGREHAHVVEAARLAALEPGDLGVAVGAFAGHVFGRHAAAAQRCGHKLRVLDRHGKA